MTENLKQIDTPDALTRLLLAWRLWLAGALVGALIALALATLWPVTYRAEAAVVVDHNLEAAYTYFTDRQLFQFMDRESRKLEALAWSDQVLGPVADQFEGLTIQVLRDEKLLLSQPGDGVWHFWADDFDPLFAQQLAGAWAGSFAAAANESRAASADLAHIRAEMAAEFGDTSQPDPERLETYFNQARQALIAADGISQYVEVSLSQAEQIQVGPALAPGYTILAGSLLGALGVGLLDLFFSRRDD